MKKFNKFIFWMIISVFVLSSFLIYASFSFSPQNIGEDNRVVVSPEEKQEEEDKKLSEKYGQGMEGILKKIAKDVDGQKTEDYYLEVAETPFLMLKTDGKVKFDKYLDKNVKVWGEIVQGETDSQMTMNVGYIDLR